MAYFLTTEDISSCLSHIIKNASEYLVIISPYLRINKRVKELLEHNEIPICVIYGKRELRPDEKDWLDSMEHITTGFRENLHAKCYLNESEALLTSMNLYEFSQVNNDEMGILVTYDHDPDLYEEIREESMRIVSLSGVEVRVVEPEPKAKVGTKRARKETQQAVAITDCPVHNSSWRKGSKGGLYHDGGCTPSKLLREVAHELGFDYQEINNRLKDELGVTISKLTPEQVAQVYARLTG